MRIRRSATTSPIVLRDQGDGVLAVEPSLITARLASIGRRNSRRRSSRARRPRHSLTSTLRQRRPPERARAVRGQRARLLRSGNADLARHGAVPQVHHQPQCELDLGQDQRFGPAVRRARQLTDQRMFRRKPAPGLIGGGRRSADKEHAPTKDPRRKGWSVASPCGSCDGRAR
jgi:hypothetical protein